MEPMFSRDGTLRIGVKPDEVARRQALAVVETTMAIVHKNLAEQGVTDKQFDAAVDEAIQQVRRRDP
jgi:hypothetical protein